MSSANAAAAQQFANRAASGQPLDVLFQQFGQVEAQELLNLIMSEIQQGINPRAMARDITRTLDQIDYGRAETIARTESLGSWNDAALANYRANSDVVGQWMWMCFPGAGTCVGCLEEDGTIYGLDEELNDHPNGRCVKAPITNDYGSILSDYGIDTEGMDFGPSPWDARQTGEEWLLAQDEATQIAAFGGKAPYYAWKSGDVPLKAFVKHVHNPVWGDHVAQSSLKDLGLRARDYAEGTIKERLAKEAYAATPIGQAEARLAVATQRARELEAMMAQAFASGRAQDAVMADYYHTVLVQRLTAEHDLERLREAQAAGEAAAREAEAAAAAVTVQRDEAAAGELRTLFGRDPTDGEVGALVGAQDGARIDLTSGDALRDLEASRPGIPSYEPVPGYTPALYMQVTDPADRYHAFRLVLSSDDTPGRYVMENLSIGVTAKGEGLGTRIFADEVRALEANGNFDRIVTEAVGSPDSMSNGYYTWARLGYDGAIPQQTLDRLAYLAQYAPERGGVPAEWASYTRISDLMATPEGQAWWKANGRAFTGEFDLTPGSYSMRTLDDYLRSHGLAPLGEE